MEEYGNANGDVNIRSLLLDAGLWTGGDDSPRSPKQRDVFGDTLQSMSTRREDGLIDETSLEYSPMSMRDHKHDANPWRDRATTGRSEPTPPTRSTFHERKTLKDTDKVMRETNRNLDDLHNLHDLIMKDTDFDDLDAVKQKSKEISSPMRLAPSHNSNSIHPTHNNTTTDSSMLGSPFKSSKRDPIKENSDLNQSAGIADIEYESKQLQQLSEENIKLKQEIRAFDGEFFEQLEDLKYRYAQLQDVLGEDPLMRATVQAKIKDGPLPLNKLAQSVRRSMTAMDRANYDSPLVNGPRAVHARTHQSGYRPDDDRDGDRLHLDGPTPPSQRDSQAFLLQSMGRGPNKLHASNQLDSIREGGVHGIGAGQYQQIRSKIGLGSHDEQGGTFANLCERRLAFELASLSRPDDAILTLVNRSVVTTVQPIIVAASE